MNNEMVGQIIPCILHGIMCQPKKFPNKIKEFPKEM